MEQDELIGYDLKERMDLFEVALSKFQQEDCPLKHLFTPGLYTRTIYMRAGLVAVSKIHKTRHQFILSQGVCSVYNGGTWDLLTAPHIGITEPGTRRVLIIHSDCVWTTMHPIDVSPENDSEEETQKAVDLIESIIIQPNPEVLELKQKELS